MRLDYTAVCNTSVLCNNALKMTMLEMDDPRVLFIKNQNWKLIYKPLVTAIRIDKLCVSEANTNLETIEGNNA